MNKRIISIITALILLLMPVLVIAAAPDHTHTVTKFMVGEKRMYLHEVTWTADDATAAIADVTIPASDLKNYQGYYLYRVITDPGATAPTDDYDIVLNDVYSFDVMEGALGNRDTANTETVEVSIPVYGQLTAVFTNNSVNSATGKIVFLFVW
jgi:hypothetical protein